MKALMICHVNRLPYRVMLCAAQAGAEVYVLGGSRSKSLRFSRYCKKFIPSKCPFDGSVSSEMVEQINRIIPQHGIDIVMPGDAESSRTFAGLRDQIQTKCFPGPGLELFDRLNDKSQFIELCEQLEIPHPKSRLYESKSQLVEELQDDVLTFPLLLKPLSLYASKGIVRVNSKVDLQKTDKGAFPKLAQEFVEGEDIGASIWCIGGEITSFIAHAVKRGRYVTFDSPEIFESLSRIASNMNLEGVYNFDMRASKEGQILYLECNPRVFFKINLSLIAGINFVAPGLFPSRSYPQFLSEHASFITSRALTTAIYKPWTLSRRDRSFAKTLVKDPVNLYLELARTDSY
jgi:predicted ATP-grasp superfamily ATP-dependent carboligase